VYTLQVANYRVLNPLSVRSKRAKSCRTTMCHDMAASEPTTLCSSRLSAVRGGASQLALWALLFVSQYRSALLPRKPLRFCVIAR
jgi:hypothetical protein